MWTFKELTIVLFGGCLRAGVQSGDDDWELEERLEDVHRDLGRAFGELKTRKGFVSTQMQELLTPHLNGTAPSHNC